MSPSNEEQQDKAVNELTPEELDAAIQTVLSRIIGTSLINLRGWARSMLLSGMDVQTVVNILKNVIADEAVKKSLHDALIRAAQAERCDDKLIGRALAEFEHLEDHQIPAEQALPKEDPPEEDADETFSGPG